MKPTEACNGTCVYCAANGDLAKHGILPRERIGPLFERFAGWLRGDARRNLRFIWHGGEPMICGPAYYGTVVEQQRRVFDDRRHRVKNTMQSNLSLVTEKWIPYLRALLDDQAIGTSFDIIEGIRGLAGGKDLAEAWFRGLHLLRANNIRVGAVYVVHRKSLIRARDLYYYFRNLDPALSVRFNPLYSEGRANEEESEGLWITAEEYGQFLIELCEVWLADDRRLSVMPLAEWYRAWRGNSSLCCDSRGTCHESHLGVDPNGTVYGCGRASDNGAHRLGNIFEDELEVLLDRRREGGLASRSVGLQAGPCRDCRYWELCHGGCPMMAWLYHGDLLRETYFCGSRKRLFEHYEEWFGPPAYAISSSASDDGMGESHA